MTSVKLAVTLYLEDDDQSDVFYLVLWVAQALASHRVAWVEEYGVDPFVGAEVEVL